MTATFREFNKKYITEKRESLRGDSLDKKIIKKVVTDPIENNKNKIRKIDKRIVSDARASLGDGGKKAMEKFDKEFGLNDTDTKGRNIVYSLDNSNREKENDVINLIKQYNFKYKIKNFNKIKSFELKYLSLRSYSHNNILAFGDLLHRIHPLAGQGFNMTIRDIKMFLDIIESKKKLGLSLDSSVNSELEKRIKHKNFIFSNGIDFIHEFFNLERKMNTNILSKSVQIIGKNNSINKMFTKIADRGVIL